MDGDLVTSLAGLSGMLTDHRPLRETLVEIAEFAVQAIPTMILFRGPLEVDQIRGAVPKATLEAHLDRVI